MSRNATRRQFIQETALLGAASAMAKAATGSAVPRRPLGNSGIEVSILGVGGYHIGSAENQDVARQIVEQALDSGVNFFDNAWEYHDGQSEEWLGQALGSRRKEAIVMTKVCTHGRDKAIAMQMLEQSLRRLRTDYLDVWQIHEVVYDNEPEMIFRPGGAAEALLEAKKQGKVRLIGFTGHKDPAIHSRVLAHDFPFDTVQMPLNAFDATFRSFEQQILPEARKRGMAVLGMKSLGGSGEMIKWGGITVSQALRYTMSLPIATVISGMESPEVLQQNLEIARNFTPMSNHEMVELRRHCQTEAADGHLELFKTTTKYDGKVGREQHGFPSVEELPA